MGFFSRSSPLLSAGALLTATVCALALGTGVAAASGGEGGDDEVRVVGLCGRGATAKLRLKADDGSIEARFEVEHTRGGGLWRVVLVHERRVVWRGSLRARRSSGSFEVRRVLSDLPGADTVTARAWGPAGVTCRATAVLAGG